MTRAAICGPVRTCLVERAAVWFGGAVHPSTVQVARGWCSPAEMPPYWPWRRIVRDLALDDPFAAGDAGRVDELDRQLLFAAVVEALDAASRREPLLWSSKTCTGPTRPPCGCCARSPMPSRRSRSRW